MQYLDWPAFFGGLKVSNSFEDSKSFEAQKRNATASISTCCDAEMTCFFVDELCKLAHSVYFWVTKTMIDEIDRIWTYLAIHGESIRCCKIPVPGEAQILFMILEWFERKVRIVQTCFRIVFKDFYQAIDLCYRCEGVVKFSVE